MTSHNLPALPDSAVIKNLVSQCLEEDIKTGDLTAELTPEKSEVDGKIISREDGIICGTAWVNEVFQQMEQRSDSEISIEWLVKDGDRVTANTSLCNFEGYARPILTGERTALNIMQTLSGTATITAQFADQIAHTKARILDTRKTLPMLREAQKYAVLCGGGANHRMGLYDGIIIKENHLRSGKSLEQIVKDALGSVPEGTLVELEVENLDELQRGLKAGAKRIMLDDFSLEDLREAVSLNNTLNEHKAVLEASGGVSLDSITAIAETGVDFISSGSLTKHVRALDLSMLFDFK